MTEEERDEIAEEMANAMVRMIGPDALGIRDPHERAQVVLSAFIRAMGKVAQIEPEFMELIQGGGPPFNA